MSKNYLDNITNVIYNAPLWIQEVIFVDMKKNLEIKYPGLTTPPNEDEVYPAHVPLITFKGKKELETHEHNLDMNVYKFLQSCTNNLRIIDITLNNFWTLEQTSEALCTCIEKELIKEPSNLMISSLVFYLGNRIRLGEYVKRINKININELDDVLRKQKQHNMENPHQIKHIGEMLVNLGYIASNDVNKIIHIKDEAKKRFMIPTEVMHLASGQNVQPKQVETTVQNTDILQQQIKKLTAENNLLKDKLRQIFNIQNKKQ